MYFKDGQGIMENYGTYEETKNTQNNTTKKHHRIRFPLWLLLTLIVISILIGVFMLIVLNKTRLKKQRFGHQFF